MDHTSLRLLPVSDAAGDGYAWFRVHVRVNMEHLVDALGTRAVGGKRGKASALHGAVRVVVEPCTPEAGKAA